MKIKDMRNFYEFQEHIQRPKHGVLLRVELCSTKRHVEGSALLPVNVTVFENKICADAIKLGWALSHYDWHP